MSKLQDLIDSLCPNGVEFKPLGEVCEIRGRIGFRGYTRKDIVLEKQGAISLSPSNIVGENISYDNSTYISWEKYEESPEIKVNDGDVIFTKTASVGKCAIIKNLPCEATINPQLVIFKNITTIPDYLNYILQDSRFQNEVRKFTGIGSVPNISQTSLAGISIPIPPLPVQEEIVRILDRFSYYAAELQAELQARKEQYEYYRNLLLTFNPSACGCGTDDKQKDNVIASPSTTYKIQWKKMGEIGTFIRGNGLQKKDFTESGVGCIHYGQIYTHYGTSATKTKSFVDAVLAKNLLKVEKGDIVLACTSENIEDVAKAVAWLGEETIVTGGHSVVFKHNQVPKYIAYYFQTSLFFNQKKKYAYGAKVIDIKTEDLAKILIPVPPIEVQEKIVAILDRFEALVNDISKGLPAEIEAQKTRYEYYRNKLLTFKPLPA